LGPEGEDRERKGEDPAKLSSETAYLATHVARKEGEISEGGNQSKGRVTWSLLTERRGKDLVFSFPAKISLNPHLGKDPRVCREQG